MEDKNLSLVVQFQTIEKVNIKHYDKMNMGARLENSLRILNFHKEKTYKAIIFALVLILLHYFCYPWS